MGHSPAGKAVAGELGKRVDCRVVGIVSFEASMIMASLPSDMKRVVRHVGTPSIVLENRFTLFFVPSVTTVRYPTKQFPTLSKVSEQVLMP
jgi:hypothetical protein